MLGLRGIKRGGCGIKRMESRVLDSKKIHRETEIVISEAAMLIGAVVAGLLILSLFLQMVSSSPKPNEEAVPGGSAPRHPEFDSTNVK